MVNKVWIFGMKMCGETENHEVGYFTCVIFNSSFDEGDGNDCPVFVNTLSHVFFSIGACNLIVFDECHRFVFFPDTPGLIVFVLHEYF